MGFITQLPVFCWVHCLTALGPARAGAPPGSFPPTTYAADPGAEAQARGEREGEAAGPLLAGSPAPARRPALSGFPVRLRSRSRSPRRPQGAPCSALPLSGCPRGDKIAFLACSSRDKEGPEPELLSELGSLRSQGPPQQGCPGKGDPVLLTPLWGNPSSLALRVTGLWTAENITIVMMVTTTSLLEYVSNFFFFPLFFGLTGHLPDLSSRARDGAPTACSEGASPPTFFFLDFNYVHSQNMLFVTSEIKSTKLTLLLTSLFPTS